MLPVLVFVPSQRQRVPEGMPIKHLHAVAAELGPSSTTGRTSSPVAPCGHPACCCVR